MGQSSVSNTPYVVGLGENEWLEDILAMEAIQLILYKNVVAPDGSTVIASLSELPTGGGRGYLPIELVNALSESGESDGKWYVSQNSQGKGQAQYGLAASPQNWTFLAQEVTDANTVYGIAGYSWRLPFDTGLAAGTGIKVGDTLVGATSAAQGIITGVIITSGSWAAGNAAGWFCIKTKSGNFQDNEVLQVGATPMATANTGTSNGGDALKRLRFVVSFSTGIPITQLGDNITWLPLLTLASA